MLKELLMAIAVCFHLITRTRNTRAALVMEMSTIAFGALQTTSTIKTTRQDGATANVRLCKLPGGYSWKFLGGGGVCVPRSSANPDLISDRKM